MDTTKIRSRKPSIPITLSDGKERHMRVTFWGMSEYQKATGRSWLSGFADYMERVKSTNAVEAMIYLLPLIWSTLVWEDNALTLAAFGSLVDLADVGPVLEAFTALGLQMAEQVVENPLAAGEQATQSAS